MDKLPHRFGFSVLNLICHMYQCSTIRNIILVRPPMFPPIQFIMKNKADL